MATTVQPKRRSWFKRILLVLAGLFAVWLVAQLWPVWLEPGPTTTVLIGPLRPDGTIDYAAALNAEYSTGVTPENNAAVLLLQALGPEVIDNSIRAEYFQQLGIEKPPADGKYLQSLERMFAKDHEVFQRVIAEMDEAMKFPWSGADHPELARWLAINDEPLKLCAEACRRERFYSPLIPPAGGSLMDVRLDLTQESRSISRLLAVQIRLYLEAGRIEEALADAETLHRLSRLMSQHPMMIVQLTAYSHSAMAAGADAAIVQSGLLSAEQAHRQREAIAKLPSFSPMVSIVDRGERFMAMDMFQQSVMGPMLTRLTLNPNPMLTRMNETIDDVVAAMKLADFQAQRAGIDAAKEQLDQRAKQKLTAVRILAGRRDAVSSQIADVLAALLVPALQQAAGTERRSQIRQTLVLTGYALAEHRALHGEFPEKLDSLAPDLLERVPHDPYADGPIRYVMDRERGTILLYSVGENGVDDHGLMSGRVADDIGFGAVPEPMP